MMFSILCKKPSDYLCPPTIGGVEKRAKVLMDYLLSQGSLTGIYSFKDLDKIPKTSSIITYNLPNDVAVKLNKLKIKTCNSYCSGHDAPTEEIFTSEFIKVRFLTENQKDLCKGNFNEANAFVAPHGFGEHECKWLPNSRKYYIWCASLGWGTRAKGLDAFFQLAIRNPDKNFIAYCGRWNSKELEHSLLESAYSTPNLHNIQIKFDLKDEEKDKAFSHAIALCQFTRLRESFNVVALESVLRNVPVLTLDVENGGVSENLGDFNIKMNKSFILNTEILDQIKTQSDRLNKGLFPKEKFSCGHEIGIITEFME